MKRNLRRILNSRFPQNPKSPADVAAAFENEDVFNAYGYNLRQTEIFHITTINEKESSFTLFGSKGIMDMIEEFIPKNRKYLLDGTFDVTPIGYYQLLVIYIEYQNDVSKFQSIYIYLMVHPSIHLWMVAYKKDFFIHTCIPFRFFQFFMLLCRIKAQPHI